MEKKIYFLLDWLVNACLFLIVFLVPLFFLPITAEKFELNKYFLFYFLILLSLLGFLGKAVVQKGFEIKRTPLDIPLVILWFFYLVAALFSQDRYLSFFGDFGSLNLSFVGLSLMLVFYFLIVQQITSARQVLRFFYTILFSGFLCALYFLLSAASLFNWAKFGLPQHSLVSSSNVIFGFFIAVIFILSLGYVTIKKTGHFSNTLIFVLWICSAAVLLLIGFKSVWIITAIGLFLLAIFFIGHVEHSHPILNALILFFLVVTLLFSFLGEPKFLTKSLPTEISLSPKLSWNIAFSTLMSAPRQFIFGSGPGTFIYDFSKFRPDSMNLNYFWNVRFSQPYNTFFEWLTTNGILSTLVFLGVMMLIFGFLIMIWVKYVLRLKSQKKFFGEESNDNQEYRLPPLFFWLISCGWLMTLVSLFVIDFTAVHWILFWSLLGLMVSASVFLTKTNFPVLLVSLKTTPQYALVTSFVFIVLFSALFILGVYFGRFYIAETIYNQGASKNYAARVQLYNKALSYNSYRPQFYLGLADAILGQAIEMSKQNATAENVSQYLAAAVNAAKKATDIAPKNVATWEFLSNMYINARLVTTEASAWALSSLGKAVELEGNNPLFYISSGNIKLMDKRYSEAKEDFEKALSLKSDLLVGYLRLAVLSETQNNLNGAVAAMEKGLSYGGANNAEYLVNLGRYYFNRAAKNDYSMAELAFKKAISLNANYSDALYALAYLYEREGLASQALELYKRVLELNPGNKDLINKVGNLNSAPPPAEKSDASLPSSPNKKK